MYLISIIAAWVGLGWVGWGGSENSRSCLALQNRFLCLSITESENDQRETGMH